jgi:hypothetical protein
MTYVSKTIRGRLYRWFARIGNTDDAGTTKPYSIMSEKVSRTVCDTATHIEAVLQ